MIRRKSYKNFCCSSNIADQQCSPYNWHERAVESFNLKQRKSMTSVNLVTSVTLRFWSPIDIIDIEALAISISIFHYFQFFPTLCTSNFEQFEVSVCWREPKRLACCQRIQLANRESYKKSYDREGRGVQCTSQCAYLPNRAISLSKYFGGLRNNLQTPVRRPVV